MARTHRRATPMTPRGRRVAALATVTAVVGATFAYFAFFPASAPAFVRTTLAKVGLTEESPPPPPACPLTGGGAPAGGIPRRPVLAIKVENLEEARPQAGLGSADIVYEEPVEGGITRFIALFQCSLPDRVGPVRSAREVDASVLPQYGSPILAFSGAAPGVERTVEGADLRLVDESTGGDAYQRDDARVAPHNLYVSPERLYRVTHAGRVPPEPVFRYADDVTGRSHRAASVHLPFSVYSDVTWTWSRRAGAWVRFHGEVAHTTEDGDQVSADNVLVQVVRVTPDPDGGLTPEVALTGHGKAFLFRDGRVIVGTWEREGVGDVTSFRTKDGDDLTLAPGRTWVELYPTSLPVEVS